MRLPMREDCIELPRSKGQLNSVYFRIFDCNVALVVGVYFFEIPIYNTFC
jgi:hypothetical protein